jgi:hypothetical protein
MTKPKSSYCKLAAMCAVMAIVLAQSAGSLTATASPGDDPFKNVNLQAEARTVDGYLLDFDSFDKDLVVLRRKTSLTQQDFNRLRDRAEDLKRRWPQVQQAVTSAITKWKAAGVWERLDDLLLPRIADARVRSSIKSNGGLKRAFEDALRISAESDPSLQIERNFRSKVTAQVQDLRFERGLSALGFSAVPVAYNPAAPKFGDGLLCLGATIRYGRVSSHRRSQHVCTPVGAYLLRFPMAATLVLT